MRYLENREPDSNTSGRKVWAFLGDGEMDEPESMGALLRWASARSSITWYFRRQLQSAAARWTGARQRQDHPGTRIGLPRRRLERDQGYLGSRTGIRCWPGDQKGFVETYGGGVDGEYQKYKSKRTAPTSGRENFFGKAIRNLARDGGQHVR